MGEAACKRRKEQSVGWGVNGFPLKPLTQRDSLG